VKLLDLFCGAGGAAVGYHRAGFTEIVGVDNKPMKRYPFEFVQANALEYLSDLIASGEIAQFDLIHASPPCQRYSIATKSWNGEPRKHPDFVSATRTLLQVSGINYIIENVVGAPLIDPIVLCGTMFPGLRVIRHRLFESNVLLMAPPCGPHPLCYTVDKRKPHYGQLDEWTAFVQVNGGGNCSVASARDAMGIDWMTKAELNEAIPPAYTEYLGQFFI
jgi:DNA (cytosine-5)-methyltransferase 1